MRSLLIVFLFSIFALSSQAGTIYKWVDDNGTFTVTDDAQRIPDMYRTRAVSVEMSDIENYVRFTKVETSSRVQLNDRLQELRAATHEVARKDECAGHATVEQVRRSHNERGNTYNSLFYVVRNACGDVTIVTRANPQVYIEPGE